MTGWLVLTYADDTYEKFETPGETFVEVAAAGYPARRAFATEGVVSAEWFAEEPEVKGQSVAEAAAEAEAAALAAAAGVAVEEEKPVAASKK